MGHRNYRFRKATLADIPELREMCQATLRAVNIADYTPEEIEDWASCSDDTSHLTDLITNLYFLVALNEADEIIGCTSIRKNGYLHSMFVHKDYQRRGVASFLLSKAEKYATENQIETITSEVSITAKPFFERKGYSVVEEQKRKANRLFLTNYWMKKELTIKDMSKDEKLNILWTTDNKDTIFNMLSMYAINSIKRGWWKQINIILWGASVKLVANDTQVQTEVLEMLQAGISIEACQDCCENFNVTPVIRKLGITVKYMGASFTQYIKDGEKILTM